MSMEFWIIVYNYPLLSKTPFLSAVFYAFCHPLPPRSVLSIKKRRLGASAEWLFCLMNDDLVEGDFDAGFVEADFDFAVK